MASVRKKGVRKTIEVTSPFENPFVAEIARATNREDVDRMNMFGKVRIVQNQNTPDEIVTERDYPMGDVQVDTILLCLIRWDIQDDEGRVYPITRDNVLDLISGQERRWLHDQVMKFNPIWMGEEEEKPELEGNSDLSLSDSSKAKK